jgi:elongation factor Ts
MSQISASMVKDLRESTGAGMMDCKKALIECNGDLQSAIDWLRKKGLSSAAKKAGRVAAEGLVGALVEGNIGALVELNSETDFVARNDKFQSLIRSILSLTLQHKHIDSLNSATCPQSGKLVPDVVTEHVAIIGENIHLRRVDTLSIDQGVIGSYVHNAVEPGLGKIAVLVALKSTSTATATLQELAKKLAMHVAASKPLALTADKIDPELVARERAIVVEKTKAEGKPEAIIEKLVEGRMRKFFEQYAFLEQEFVFDGKTKISDLLVQQSNELGAPVSIVDYRLYVLGEGIEKQETDFAKEVAAAANS